MTPGRFSSRRTCNQPNINTRGKSYGEGQQRSGQGGAEEGRQGGACKTRDDGAEKGGGVNSPFQRTIYM